MPERTVVLRSGPGCGDAAVLDRCRLVLEALADPQRIIHIGGQWRRVHGQAAG